MSVPESLRPWPPYKFIPVYPDGADFLGVTRPWMKRARQDGFIEVVRLRGTLVIQAAELYRIVDENTEERAPEAPRVRRTRTPEHNANIAKSVRAAAARKAEAEAKVEPAATAKPAKRTSARRSAR